MTKKLLLTKSSLATLAGATLLMLGTAYAQNVSTGPTNLEYIQGHRLANCAKVGVTASDGSTLHLRLPPDDGVNQYDQILTILLAAKLNNQMIDVLYDPTVTSGCGQEPMISVVTLE